MQNLNHYFLRHFVWFFLLWLYCFHFRSNLLLYFVRRWLFHPPAKQLMMSLYPIFYLFSYLFSYQIFYPFSYQISYPFFYLSWSFYPFSNLFSFSFCLFNPTWASVGPAPPNPDLHHHCLRKIRTLISTKEDSQELFGARTACYKDPYSISPWELKLGQPFKIIQGLLMLLKYSAHAL